MKKMLRVMALLLAAVFCVGLLAACDGGEQPATTNPTAATTIGPTPTTEAPDETTASTEVVRLPDQVMKIVSFDESLVTMYPYAVEGDTVDFMTLDTTKLGEPGEMDLLYIEGDVSIYALVDGKLVDAVAEEVLPDCIVGITSYSDGKMEVYILAQPVDEIEDENEDPEIIEEEEVPLETTLPAEENEEMN